MLLGEHLLIYASSSFPRKCPLKKIQKKRGTYKCLILSIPSRQARCCLRLKGDGCEKPGCPGLGIKQKWLNLDINQKVEKPTLKKEEKYFKPLLLLTAFGSETKTSPTRKQNISRYFFFFFLLNVVFICHWWLFFPLTFTPRLHLPDASRCPEEGAHNGDIVYLGRW